MKLYYAPLACSLADHIALLEAGATFERERVDLKTKFTESGRALTDISGKSYVPALVLDDGEVLTENIAVLDWIAATYPCLGVQGPLGRTRQLEALTFISTELHRAFKPFWHAGSEIDKARVAQVVIGHLRFVDARLSSDYLFGAEPTVADFYLFVMLLWARRFEVETPPVLASFCDRVAARPAAQAAMQYEGIA
ncbi:MAG: glutathione S-transferase [Sphingomonadales bacterium]|nr:MAG: glutathione S-transferase [Sphingomonadales bacterium]